MASLSTRLKAFWSAWRWLRTNAVGDAHRLRELAVPEIEKANKCDDTPSLWRPEGELGDERWWLLTTSNPAKYHSEKDIGAVRTALWMAQRARYKDDKVFMVLTGKMALQTISSPPSTRFQAAMKAVLDWEGITASSDVPLLIHPEWPLEKRLVLGQLAAALDHEDILAQARTGIADDIWWEGGQKADKKTIPWISWLTWFDKSDVLLRELEKGAPVNLPGQWPDSLVTAAETLLVSWSSRLGREDSEGRRRSGRFMSYANLQFSGRFNPLRCAIDTNSVSCAKALIHHGVALDELGSDSVSGLSKAILSQSWPMVSLLASSGANVMQAQLDNHPMALSALVYMMREKLIDYTSHDFQHAIRWLFSNARKSPFFSPKGLRAGGSWHWFFMNTISNPGSAPVLAALLEGVPSNWHLFTFKTEKPKVETPDENGSYIPLSVCPLRKALDDDQCEFLKVMVGTGPTLLSLPQSLNIPLGMAMALWSPKALSVWLEKESPSNLQTLTGAIIEPPAEVDSKKSDGVSIRENLWQKGDSIFFMALRSVAPEIAISALLDNPVLAPFATHPHSETGENLWSAAMRLSTPACKVLEVLFKKMGPIPGSDDTPLPAMKSLFEKPRNEALIDRLLEARQLPINRRLNKQGETLLSMCLHEDDREMFIKLLAHGANPSLPKENSVTAQASHQSLRWAQEALSQHEVSRMESVLPSAPPSPRRRV